MARSTFAALACCCAVACSGPPAKTPAPTYVPPSGPHALWSASPASLDNPFPDARLGGPDGGNGVRPRFWIPFVPSADESAGGSVFDGYLASLGQTFSQLSGFGNDGAQFVRFSDLVDPASLASAFAFVRLGAPPVVETAAPTVSYDPGLGYATVRPGRPLQPATPYALVLTSAAAVPSGVPLVRSPDFDLWARGEGAGPIQTIASALGKSPEAIVFASFFTTEDVRHDLASLAAWVGQPLSGPPPLHVAAAPVTACTPGEAPAAEQCPEGVLTPDGGVTGILGPWLMSEGWEVSPAHVGTVVIGDVDLQDVRDAEDGHFAAAAVANPSSGRTMSRQFVLTTPDPAKVPMPASGWPMVVAGHGLGGGNSVHEDANGYPLPTFCLAMAEFLAQNGYGCLGIDAPSHQSRGSAAAFFNLQDLSVTRDYVREMVFDEMQLGRVLAAWPPGLHGVTVDPTRLAYVGQSLGSVEGTIVLTLDPRLKGGLLLVPGGGLTDIVQSPVLGSEVDLLLSAYLGIGYTEADGGVAPGFAAALPIVMSLGQAIVESADPINHAAFLPPAVHALVDEGEGDTIMPNPTTDALAAALGFPTLSAATQNPAGVDGLWKWDLTKYGLDPTVDQPHFLFGYIREARTQAGAYLSSFEDDIPAP